MGKVSFREMVKIQFMDQNVVPGSTIYVDPGTHLSQQNQDVLYVTMWKYLHNAAQMFMQRKAAWFQ